ncbi:MAG: hypothetical protein JRH08_06805 [Deltaproteobacteria bacterium]|nr:hypothetical protein [Deltaproteobacteria bacterium]MBW1929066.1 hypothetical protein [Deltaproteobacteria bacterium]MBW2025207.1 hypothetical protein [Deltaproteobacteria bacterium]MBW2125399.1 hypothetical protein [Deltaproteobacteria bacterium]
MAGSFGNSEGIIFPHGRVHEAELKNLSLLFHVIRIGMPWHMDPTPWMSQLQQRGQLQIHRPSEDLLFDETLKNLLKEAKTWLDMNRQGSFSSFLKAVVATGSAEEDRWKISQAIKEMGKSLLPQAHSEGLYQQLLLHLYQESEENRKSAKRALDHIENSPSPLSEALGEEAPSPALGTGFDVRELSLPVNEANLQEILEAWTELFGPILSSCEIALTLDHNILNYLVEQFEEAANQDIKSAQPLKVHSFELPDCSMVPWDELTAPEGDKRPGKEVAQLFSEEVLMGLVGDGMTTTDSMIRLNEYIHSTLPVDLPRNIQLSLARLLPLDPDAFGNKAFLARFSGKALMHIEI